MGKDFLTIDVLEKSKERLNYLCDNFSENEIWLSFSGGKDSSVCFYLLKEILMKRKIKTLNILIIDLEAHYVSHIDFINEIVNDKDIEVRGYWICLPFNLSNASSSYMPKWLCWDSKDKDKWIRNMPDSHLLINENNNPFGFYRKGMEFEEFIFEFPKWLIKNKGIKKIGQIIGIRTQESYNRYMKIKVSKHRQFFDNKKWILKQKSTGQETYSVHLIYDWNVEDVWKYLSTKSYADVYNKMYLAGYPIHKMRICQPYGEEQRDNIELFAKIEPHTWERMVNRVNGANFAKIYNGKNVLKGRISLPEGITWEQWGRLILNTMPPYLKDHYLRRINVFLRWWRKDIENDIPSAYAVKYQDNEGFDDDGVYIYEIYDEHSKDTKKEVPSWRRITKVLVKGDYLCKNLTFTANKEEYEKLEKLKEEYNV